MVLTCVEFWQFYCIKSTPGAGCARTKESEELRLAVGLVVADEPRQKTLDLEWMEGMDRNSGYKMQLLCNCCKILRKAPNFFKTFCMGNHEPKSVALTCLAFGQLQEIAATAATVVVGTCPDHDDPTVQASVMITCSAPHGLCVTVLGHAPSQAIYLLRMFPA